MWLSKILHIILISISRSVSANNLYKQSTEKYFSISMNSLVDIFYRGVTGIQTVKTKHNFVCMEACARLQHCTSINMSPVRSDGTFDCILLNVNPYNTNAFEKRDGWILKRFPNTPCEQNVCKNVANCNPNYSTDKNTCTCYFSAYGKYCEKLLPKVTCVLKLGKQDGAENAVTKTLPGPNECIIFCSESRKTNEAINYVGFDDYTKLCACRTAQDIPISPSYNHWYCYFVPI